VSQEHDDTTTEQNEGWWEHSLNRRDAQKLGLGVAAVVGLAGCGDDGKVVDLDALDAQKKGGWDVGDTNKKLVFAGGTTTDAKGGADWKGYTKASKLLEATRPANDAYAKWQMPTLFQSLEQVSLAAQMKPVSTAQTQETYNKGRALGSLVTSAEEPEKTLLIVDMPGTHAVAAAAGMSQWVEPVFKLDNWPHPKGVVKSHETLGAALYYAGELEENKGKRDKAKAPAAIVLDSNRLASYGNPDKEFDNRYFVDLPTADELKAAGVKRVVYVPMQEQAAESDDLNDAAVEYGEAGIDVQQVPMSSFGKDPNYKPPEKTEDGTPVEDPTGGYYYGHAHQHHTHFYTHYPMFIWMPMPMYGWGRPMGGAGPTRARAPSYKPKARPTKFSSRRTGGAKGVGRSKPTGFGKVSSRVGKNGKIMGTRSGSTGRFRSSSSFGG
jgi:hypothetical protein